jgi:hypothetical protein
MTQDTITKNVYFGLLYNLKNKEMRGIQPRTPNTINIFPASGVAHLSERGLGDEPAINAPQIEL